MMDAFFRSYSDRLFGTTSRRIAWYIVSYGLYTAIAGSFDVAFTLRTTGSFTVLCLLYLFYYICLALSFVASTLLVSSGRFSRGFALNLFFQASIGLLMYFAMPVQARPYVLVPYFMLKGISEGFFWSTRHAAMNCLTTNESRDRFMLSLQIGSILVSVVMPFLSGLFMRFNTVEQGYSGIYLAGAAAAFASLLLGPRIVSAPPPRPDLRKFISFLKRKDTAVWRTYIFFSSINGSLALFSSGVLNVGVLKTEFNLGMFASFAALCSAAFMLGLRRRIKGKTVNRLVFVASGAAGDLAGRLAYTLLLSVPGLLFKTLCDSFLSPLRSIFSENIVRRKSDLMAASGEWTALEPFLFQELCILGARVFAFSLCTVLFSVLAIGPSASARAILFVLAFAPLIDFILLRRIDKENLHRMTLRDSL